MIRRRRASTPRGIPQRFIRHRNWSWKLCSNQWSAHSIGGLRLWILSRTVEGGTSLKEGGTVGTVCSFGPLQLLFSMPPGFQEVKHPSLLWPSSMRLCLTMGPRTMEPPDHELEPATEMQTNCSSVEFFLPAVCHISWLAQYCHCNAIGIKTMTLTFGTWRNAYQFIHNKCMKIKQTLKHRNI